MDTNDFYRLPKELARADGFISKVTGEPIKFSASGKLIYTYMLSKNEFFTEKIGGQHYESQATIARFCGIEYKSAGVILRTFLENGVMEGKKGRPEKGGQQRWFYYKVYSDLVLWEGRLDDFKILETKTPKIKAKEGVKTKQSQNTYQHQALADWDDSQLPF